MIALTLARTIRLALLSAGLLAPLSIGVLLRVIWRNPEVVAAAAERAATPCDPTRFDAPCPDDQRCVAGECLVVRDGERAAAGAACDGLVCAPGLECHRGTCMAVADLPLARPACREPAVHEALEALLRICGQARGRTHAELMACDEEVWAPISQRNRDLEKHVMAMPGAFSVFFPHALPDQSWEWPSPETHAWLKKGLAGHRAVLRDATQIMVIGRASLTGDEKGNTLLAERRASLVESLLKDELKAEMPSVVRWGLADKYPLSVATMLQRIRATPIADDAVEQEKLEVARGAGFDLQSLPPEDWRELSDKLNRVVLVVPLPCNGHEFNPLPAFRGGREPERKP